MPGFVIKDLPEALHRKLKEQAARNHRRMTKEVLAVLEQALGLAIKHPVSACDGQYVTLAQRLRTRRPVLGTFPALRTQSL